MTDIGIMTNLRSDTLHTKNGKRVRMLSTEDEQIWRQFAFEEPIEESQTNTKTPQARTAKATSHKSSLPKRQLKPS